MDQLSQRKPVTIEIEKYPKKIMIQNTIHISVALSLKFIDINANKEKYLEILTEFFEEIDPDLNYSCFQQDNAINHVNQLMNSYFESKNIEL